MTKQLEGEELAIAAAKAIGWTRWANGSWYESDDSWVASDESGGPNPTTQRLESWLRARGEFVRISFGPGYCAAGTDNHAVGGEDMEEALQRLVVAVAAREAKA